MAYEPGDPIDIAASVAPRRLGDLLGRVHVASLRYTSRADVPTRLLEWWRNFAEARGDAAALRVLDRVDEVALTDGLPDAVVYGDPSPEVHDADGRLALIDWGTPSWGPLAYDVGAWLAWIRRSGAVAGYEASFLGAYAKHRPIARAERGLLPSFSLLAESIAAP